MKKFKDHAKELFHMDKIPPCLSLMEENPMSDKDKVLDVFKSEKYESEFMTGKFYYKPISKFLNQYE